MNKEKKRIIATILLTGFMLGCQSNRYIPDLSNQIEYHYKVTIYSGKIRNKDICGFKYYNEKEQLVESVGHEYRTKFFYNNKGQLIEVFNCRMYNCQIGYRDILIYDDKGNHIEKYRITGRHPNIDTIKKEQIKFYDKNKHLIKEFIFRNTNGYGKLYEYWKYYIYEDDKIVTEITTCTNDTAWVGSYSYDKMGNLIAIIRKNGQKQQKETFEYDQSNNLIKKKIEDNSYPLTKDVSFSATNWSATFLYNEQGKLIEEKRYNHKGEEYLKYIYVYEYKK